MGGALRTSSIFLRKIVGAMFMRVNSTCAHQDKHLPSNLAPAGGRYRDSMAKPARTTTGRAPDGTRVPGQLTRTSADGFEMRSFITSVGAALLPSSASAQRPRR